MRHATNATSGLTFLAPSVRNAALRRRSSYPPPIPMQCPCIWPKSAAVSRRERMLRSSSMAQANHIQNLGDGQSLRPLV